MYLAAEKEFIFVPSGSFFICSPPVTNTDRDYFVHFPRKNKEEAIRYLENQGLSMTSHEYMESSLFAFRSGIYNIILVTDVDLFIAKRSATELARRLNLQNKDDRINLFHYFEGLASFMNYNAQFIRDANPAERVVSNPFAFDDVRAQPIFTDYYAGSNIRMEVSGNTVTSDLTPTPF